MNLYNEIDPKAAAWCRELVSDFLVPNGTVDERSITDLNPNDLHQFTQCHFFAGIAGWPYALDLAGWPSNRPVWTGSCPCQPYSAAGKRKADADPRNLWPQWFHLIRECRPVTIFGEQVASAIGHGWFDGISADLEGEGYTVGAVVLGAHSLGAPHMRQRLYWVAHAVGSRERGRDERRSGESWQQVAKQEDGAHPANEFGNGCQNAGSVADTGSERSLSGSHAGIHCSQTGTGARDVESERFGDAGSVAHSLSPRLEERPEQSAREELQAAERGGSHGCWSDYQILHCSDGKARRSQSRIHPLAHGVPGRVGLLRGYGNAIVPAVAAEFVKAFMETI